jgi:hypothetical protein
MRLRVVSAEARDGWCLRLEPLNWFRAQCRFTYARSRTT